MQLRVSTNFNEMDFDLIHGFLGKTYWSENIPAKVLRKALENSLCFALFDNQTQLGFARMVTDRSTFAYMADVFILSKYQGQGLSTFLLDEMFKHPDLIGLRRMMLVTRDAQGIYEKYGFTEINNPKMVMQKWDPEVYEKS